MKSFITILTMLALVAVSSVAMAASYGGYAFPLYSSASATVRTSAAINVRGFKTKSMLVEGATLTSNAGSLTFKNMSGTVLAQCSQDNTVWETCVANDYAQTAISRTTNGIFTWSDAVNYIRLKWTGGTVGTKLKAWFSWIEN